MGRHSAPDDDEQPESTVALADAPADAAEQLAADERGRHSRGADVETTGPVPGIPVRRDEERAAVQDERPTERLDLAAIEAALERSTEQPTEQPAGPPTEQLAPPPAEQPVPPSDQPVEATEPPKGARGAQSTTADLALVRRHSDVRNRVIGGALVPFVLYAVVLLVLSATAVQYLLWIWIPTVTAGVLIGFVLDAGHKRYRRES